MLVVFDTNVFHGDFRADRGRLRSILDAALPAGALELFVPEIVLLELDKQFAARTKRVIKEINKAIGGHEGELTELGLDGPPRMIRDQQEIDDYKGTLEARLLDAGAEILGIPTDLAPAVDWSVKRRKPFKQNGEGFPDAVIWLSVLDLSESREEEIVLVTSNTKDFGDGSEPARLASEMRDDLEQRGQPPDRVRLVAGIDSFADELSEDPEVARARAEELNTRGVLATVVDRTLSFTSIEQGPLELGVELDTDPQVTAWDVNSVEVESAAGLPGDELVIEVEVEASLLLDLLIFRADFYVAEQDDDVHFNVSDSNYNDHYIEAESEVVVVMRVVITTNTAGEEGEAEIQSVRLAPSEVVGRALRGRELEDLVRLVRDNMSGEKFADYEPDEAIESDIEEIEVLAVSSDGRSRIEEIIDSDGYRHVAHLSIRVRADLSWTVAAPSSFDADRFASLALNEESGAPLLQGVDSHVPLDVDLTAAWDPEHGWHDVDVNEIYLESEEAKRRVAIPSAADRAFIDHLVDQTEDERK